MTVTPLLGIAGSAPDGRALLAHYTRTRRADDSSLDALKRARRLASGLVGEAIPELVLKTGSGRTVQLAREATSGIVIYMYAGGDPPLGPVTAAPDDAQHGAFDRERDAFRAYSLNVFGVSSEPERATRVRVLEGRVCSHELLSDPGLQLARTLGLPTFTHEEVSYYDRLTIVAFAGRIARVFYPVESPRRSASQVTCWLTVTGH